MKTVGLICPDVADAYMAKAVAYLEHNLKEYGYDCILYCSGHGYEDRQIAVSTILNKRIDALVLIGSSYADDDADSEQVEYIREAAKQVPVFLMNGYVRGDNIYCALCNDYDITFLTVSELIQSGRKRILFLSDSHSYSANQKLRGYEEALRQAGIPVDESLKLYIQNDINQVRDYLLFRSDLKMDAVFATEDGLAAGALKYAKKKGISVPESISIIEYNNSELSVCCDPELSTIDSRGERLCRIIIDSMMLLKQNKTIKQAEACKIFLQALPCLLLILIVIGGIIFGIFTATEGSVVAVVYSLILSLVFYKSIKLKDLPKIFIESAEMTGIIIFLIGMSGIMSWVMAFTNIPEAVSAGLLAISSSKIVIFLMINIILLVVGTFMDMTPACLIFTPIFLPVCTSLGMDPVHFGIMLIFNLCIGTITPPVGTTLFVGVKVGGVKLEDVIKQMLVYFVAIFIVLMLVTYIPQLSLWLPSLMGYV